jgi:hypothetical protein
MPFSVVADQFKVLKEADVTGKVYRLLADEPVPIYDSPISGANVMRQLKPGSLVVGYSDPGQMRQVNTSDQTFGYIQRSVMLAPVAGLDADGLYDPGKRAAVEATLPSIDEMKLAYTAELSRNRRNQSYFMMGFILVVLLGFVAVVMLSPAAAIK